MLINATIDQTGHEALHDGTIRLVEPVTDDIQHRRDEAKERGGLPRWLVSLAGRKPIASRRVARSIYAARRGASAPRDRSPLAAIRLSYVSDQPRQR